MEKLSKKLEPRKDKPTSQRDWIDKMKERFNENNNLNNKEIKFILNKILELIK